MNKRASKYILYSLLFSFKGLTQGVDLTNVFAWIFRARFSYKRLFSSYVLQKTRAKNVGEIDPRRAILFTSLKKPKLVFEIAQFG